VGRAITKGRESRVKVNQHIRFPPNANDLPLSAPPPAGSTHKRISGVGVGGQKACIAEMRDVNLPGPENQEVAWAELSILSQAVLLITPNLRIMQMATSKVENLAQVILLAEVCPWLECLFLATIFTLVYYLWGLLRKVLHSV